MTQPRERIQLLVVDDDARREGAVEVVSKPLDVDGLLHLIAETAAAPRDRR